MTQSVVDYHSSPARCSSSCQFYSGACRRHHVKPLCRNDIERLWLSLVSVLHECIGFAYRSVFDSRLPDQQAATAHWYDRTRPAFTTDFVRRRRYSTDHARFEATQLCRFYADNFSRHSNTVQFYPFHTSLGDRCSILFFAAHL